MINLNRINVGLLMAVAIVFSSCTKNVDAQGSESPNAISVEHEITPATEKAIADGLKYLKSKQNTDGSFGDDRQLSGNVGVVGLAGLAFLSHGSTTDRGDYADSIRKCIDYILGHCSDTGLIDNPDYQSSGPMYGHGFATLFLAEVYGMPGTQSLQPIVERAVALIVSTQNDEGGWRYQPKRDEADVSVTVCQMMALRAARNAGFHVPTETVDRCVAYLKLAQNPDNGFSYMLKAERESGFARSAAALVGLQTAGVYEDEKIAGGVAYLFAARPDPTQLQTSYYYYGHYYAVQAIWQIGGEPWTRWFSSVRDELVGLQLTNGNWPSRYSSEYSTAMALIVLQIPNNVLPIFQR